MTLTRQSLWPDTFRPDAILAFANIHPLAWGDHGRVDLRQPQGRRKSAKP